MTAKIGLIVAGLVIIGAVIYYFVSRQMTASAAAKSGATSGGGADIDPVTGARWQTVDEANAQAAGAAATQTTGGMLH